MTFWKVQSSGSTHSGMVRESNQDSFHIDFDLGMCLVADGMGGRAGGEVASQLAVEIIAAEVHSRYDQLISKDLTSRRVLLGQAINKASLKIYERSLELPQYRGMGTTATLLWLPPPGAQANPLSQHGHVALVAHVGDSRCYLMRGGFLYQITDDHSLVNEQIKAGILKKNDPLVTQIRNVITRCVGYQEEEEVDTFSLEVEEGDVFLLCSDGLTNKVKDQELAEFMKKKDHSQAAQELISLANERGGEDNITVIISRILRS